jgi:long-chain acyl-CoA synthetase
MEKIPSYNAIVEATIRNHWEMDALTDYKGENYRFRDVAVEIEKLHLLFREFGIEEGDRIALYGRNCAYWGIVFFATLTYGAVGVPILHEFKPEQVHNIINHSEAKLAFIGDQTLNHVNAEETPTLQGIFGLKDMSCIYSTSSVITPDTEVRSHMQSSFNQKYPGGLTKKDIHYHKDDAEETALINYTSGTTGFSKGVIIPYRALWSNYDFALIVLGKQVHAGDKVLSILPMAHMYGMAFEFLFEFLYGCHVYFLTRTPSPKIILMAFAEIKPIIIISVPLIIEKVIRNSVFPKLQKPGMKLLLHTPIINKVIKKKICEQITEAFGGSFYEIIIGGAAFSNDVEVFLKDIGFHFTVGYGTTECAPIIAYDDWHTFRTGSCGKCVPHMEVRIDSKDPEHTVGEILCRGLNVTPGYYKNPEATEQTIDKEGWYHTGDLALMDKDGYIYIKGRSKNMLLSANGQNVYPEELEDKINAMPYVTESIVIQKADKFYALIYPNLDRFRSEKKGEDIAAQMEENRIQVNKLLPSYAQIAGIKLYDEEFEKTPKKSIKRFLYVDAEI